MKRMKVAALILGLLTLAGIVVSPCFGDGTPVPTPKVRIYLVNSTLASANVLRGLTDKCNGVGLTIDKTRADYAMEAIASDNASNNRREARITLYDKTGGSFVCVKKIP